MDSLSTREPLADEWQFAQAAPDRLALDAEIVRNEVGIPTQVVSYPVFVTPLGLVLHDPSQ